MMWIGIVLFLIAIGMIVYVLWLFVHYLKDSFISNRNVGVINKEISENLEKIKAKETTK